MQIQRQLLRDIVRSIPKVELHVHLEGTIQATTLLKLARRNSVNLPAQSEDELAHWYQFTDFAHFAEIWMTISSCIRTVEDIEEITRDFLMGQAEQNIRYSEVSYTPQTHFRNAGIPFRAQLAAINRARAWAAADLGVWMGLVVDISRNVTPEEGLQVAAWAIEGMGEGVIALGLGGPEIGNPPSKFSAAFALAREAGLARVPHAGETVGAESVRGALHELHADRIGHGVRCLEDPDLVKVLRSRAIPLEVCPTSNVCLKVVPALSAHPLPRLLDEGLCVTINSDDPPMFNTTLTDEYLAIIDAFDLTPSLVKRLMLNAVRSSFLGEDKQDLLAEEIERHFDDKETTTQN